jgi:aspartyl protease family protein
VIRDVPIQALLIGLMLVLPLSALLSRRVPAARLLWSAIAWAAIFAVGAFVVSERERFDPYFARLASALDLGDQRVVGGEVRIRMAADGHFWARARIGGIERRLLIDSGATLTALSSGTARAAGLQVRDSVFPMIVRTANGSVRADVSEIGELRLGAIVARDLPVVVSPAFGDTDVLGMNFLSRLKSWRVEGRTLILTPHHPQREFT